jgi:ribulose kinase
MKRNILLGTVLSLAVSLPAFADMPAAAQSETPQHKEAMTKCEKKAKKHNISEEEMKSYINQCVSKKMEKEQNHDAAADKKAKPSDE